MFLNRSICQRVPVKINRKDYYNNGGASKRQPDFFAGSRHFYVDKLFI